VRFTVYMTEQDEPPLLEFVRQTEGHIIRVFPRVWPPVPLESPPRTCGEDECLAIWYPNIIGEAELRHPDCHPEKVPKGWYDAWSLPFVTFQRQWYWKRQGTILAVEMDYRAFRPNRPEDAEFTAREVADFERRLALLCQRAEAIRDWCISHLRNGYIGEGAWRESEELRR
jgi:hypothetical protein